MKKVLQPRGQVVQSIVSLTKSFVSDLLSLLEQVNLQHYFL